MKISVLALCFSALSGAFLTVSCNTGIEGTKAIKMSRAEMRETRPSDEDRLAAQVTSDPLRLWTTGKEFLIADNKAAVVLELPAGVYSNPDEASLVGKKLLFKGVTSRPTPGGERVAVLEFEGEGGTYRFNTSRRPEVARATFTGLDLPMIIDLGVVECADSLLKGRQLWIRTRLWYDAAGNTIDGRKFVPITVTGVSAGTMLFPLRVEFVDDKGAAASVLMNVNGTSAIGSESRTLSGLFSLTDPKLRYPSIRPEVWVNICDGRVASGMTKDECKLALGNPTEVDTGHNWNSLLDVWQYSDGTYLQFQDGLLVNFRH